MFILSIENSPGSVEGSGSIAQITPKLENKAFSGKPTQYIQLKRPYNTAIEIPNKGCGR
jgi:hypothetical protein